MLKMQFHYAEVTRCLFQEILQSSGKKKKSNEETLE